MNDVIISGMAANQQIRFYCAYTKELTETARQIHNTSPVATAALGRLLTAGTMMGSMCKNKTDVITLQIQCSGPIGGLTVTAKGDAAVKGYVNHPDIILPANKMGKLDVGGALDLGVLSVIKDLGLKEPYIGQTNLVTGEIAEDLTYYFAASEQIPTSVALGVLMEKSNTVRHAGGFIIQLLPFAEEGVICDLEERLKDFSSVTAKLEQGLSPTDMMEQLFKGYDIRYNDTVAPAYQCDCSKERVQRAIRSISKKDMEEMIADGKPIEVNCEFCGSHYIFQPDDLKAMLQ